jgi:hypothetical protein
MLTVTISVYRLYTDDFSLNTMLFSSFDWQSAGDELESLNTNINLSEIKDSVRTHPPNRLSFTYLLHTYRQPRRNKYYIEMVATAIAV